VSTISLIDNWTLQDVGETLSDGIDFFETQEILINQNSESFHYKEIPRFQVQIDCLTTLINDIVLRDELRCDPRQSHAWRGFPAIRDLSERGLIQPTAEAPTGERSASFKNACVQKLCVTGDMREIQEKNAALWKSERRTYDTFFSQVVWGTAGYMARSAIGCIPYSPYPLRRNLLQKTAFYSSSRDSVLEVSEWMRIEGIATLHETNPSMNTRSYQLILPPLATEIIESTSDASELLKTAYEARDEYAKLREWLGEYQTALVSEDFREITKRSKLLDSVARFTRGRIGSNVTGETRLNLGYSVLGLVGIDYSKTIPDPRNFFGVRATMNKLIFNKKGDRPIKKLLKLLNVDRADAESILLYLNENQVRATD
jgi:hypothetical protein